MKKERADVLLTEKGLVSSREKAKRYILEGIVFIGTNRVNKPGELIDSESKIYIKKNKIEFVSRGGYKLKKMIDEYNINLKDKICFDIGSSTGGFTDCMLQNGAKKVYAIDVGYNQLAYKLRIDKRVIVMEKTNIRYLNVESIIDRADFISIDVSFISLELVIEKAIELMSKNSEIVALIKPQFEAGRESVGKGGIVRDKKVHIDVLKKIYELSREYKLNVENLTYSPITGTTGNIEFLIYLNNYKDNNREFDYKKIVEDSYKSLKK